MKRSVMLSLAALATAAVVLGQPLAYDTYSVNKDATNCRKCHGDFRAVPYVSKVDGQSWADDAHDVHRSGMLSGDCDVCHFSGRFPTYIGKAAGGTATFATEPYGCAGCHGRSQDGTGSATIPTEGFGAGLRQRHWRGGVTECLSCHSDSNPATKTVAGENVPPPYYDNTDLDHDVLPTDPCNPSPALVEDYKGSTLGLDNDGNGLFDMGDPACNPTAVTPGEAGGVANPMIVTSFDRASGDVTVSFGTACGASQNLIEYGPLASLATYAYSGQVCGVGNAGTATFNVPAGSFFLVVAHDGAKEGSYGTRRAAVTLTERPEDTTSAACPLPQDLATRCDAP